MNERNQHTDKSESEQIKDRVAHFARRARLNKQMREQKARGEEPLWPTDMAQPEVFPALGRTSLDHPNSFEKPPRIHRLPVLGEESVFKIPVTVDKSSVEIYESERDAQLKALSQDDPTEPIPVISSAEQNPSNGYNIVLDKMKEIAEDRPADSDRSLDHRYVGRVREGLKEALGALPTDESIEQVYSMIDELGETVFAEDQAAFHRRLGDVIRELERLSKA